MTETPIAPTTAVTIAIPVFRARVFIADTVRSALAQTHAHVVIDIAVEPPADEALETLTPFMADRRVTVTTNEQRLGWVANVAGLIRRVRTPFFVILPHDDLLARDYVATLAARVENQPGTVVAYADMLVLASRVYRKSLPLPASGVFDRVLAFLLAGAEAVPWRGVTRTDEAASRNFPTDGYGGFAVECEWALHLLLCGHAERVARPLYFKRIDASRADAASRLRVEGVPRERLLHALDDHRARMLALTTDACFGGAERALVECALDAAMLRRHMTFGIGALTGTQLATASAVIEETRSIADGRASDVASMAHEALSRHAHILGDRSEALTRARTAADAAPHRWEPLIHLGRLLLECGRIDEASSFAHRAASLAPHALGVDDLIDACARVNAL